MSKKTGPEKDSAAEEEAIQKDITLVRGGVEAAGVTATADELEQVLSPVETEAPEKKSNIWKIVLICVLVVIVLCCCSCIGAYLMFGEGL